MVPTVTESWQRRSFRLLATRSVKVLPMTARALKVLPIPKARKWALGGVVADGLGFALNSRKVVQMAEGFKMELDLGESYERRMYFSRLYAPVLTSLFKHLLVPGDTVID